MITESAALLGTSVSGHRVLSIKFSQEGMVKFRNFTGENINRRVLMLLGHEVVRAPGIKGVISGVMLELSGNFTHSELSKMDKTISRFNRHGERRVFYPNGKLHERSTYKNGVKVGEYDLYDENGKREPLR